MSDLYSDPLITISDEGIRVRSASFFAGDKTTRWNDVEKIRAVTPTVWNGRFKLWGPTGGRTWMAKDWARPARETIFILHRKGEWSRVGFTVEDAPRVKQILKEKGVLEDEQGDALPTPLPQENRPMWQWAAFWSVALLVTAVIAQTIYYYPQLPPRVATHFNGSGHADGFGDKSILAGALVGGAVFVSGLVLGISYYISRTKAAIAGHYTLWIGAATLAFLLVIANLAYTANLSPTRCMGGWPWLAAIGFIATLAAITTRMLWRLARRDGDEASPMRR